MWDLARSLRRRRNKLEADLRELIGRYDERMFEAKARIDELQGKFKSEREEYDALRDYFDMIDKDQAIQAAEERAIAADKERENAHLKKAERGLTRFQALFRGRAARATAAAKGLKGHAKAKKGKGKAKKGKK